MEETGNPFSDDVVKYADWLEERLTASLANLSEESTEFIYELLRSQIDLPPDIVEAVNEHFWELI